MIDSSKFFSDYNTTHTQPQRLLIRYKDPVEFLTKYVSIVDDDTFPQQKFSPTIPMSVDLFNISIVVGSSHGLFGTYENEDEDILMVVLWNPSINKSVAINVPNVLDRPYKTLFGYGVCPNTCDPKIVKITHGGKCPKSEIEIPFQVEVFTSSSGFGEIH